MILKATVLWVLGLLTLVPYGLYQLLFEAQREEYAFYTVLVGFWIFGYWGVMGPVISAIKARQVMRALELAKSREELERIIHSQDSRQVAIDLIASENKIPKFLARKIYDAAIKRFAQAGGKSGQPVQKP